MSYFDSVVGCGFFRKQSIAIRLNEIKPRAFLSGVSVGQDCDGPEKIPDRFFNNIDYQRMKLHVLQFKEWIFYKDGTQINYVY